MAYLVTKDCKTQHNQLMCQGQGTDTEILKRKHKALAALI